MNIEEERKEWKLAEANIDRFVDRLVFSLRDDCNAVPVAYMAVDMAFRSYTHWIQSAQMMKINPSTARNAAINLISTMIMEMAMRMAGREDGMKQSMEIWLGEFMLDLRDELVRDLEDIMQTKNENA